MAHPPHTFLIVGLGSIGLRHARNLRRLGAGRILAVRSGQGVRPVPPELEIETFTNFEDAFAQGPTIGLVCNPTRLHLETATLMLRAGLDVLVEKPISHTLSGVSDLVHLAQTTGRLLGVAYPLRFHPLVIRTRQWLAENRLGAVRFMRASVGQYPPAWTPQQDYRQSYAVRQDLGGGCVRTFIHEIDLVLHLLGLPQSVTAITGHLSGLETDAEDLAEILLGYKDRLGSVHIDYIQKGPAYSRFIQLIGERAALWLDFQQATLKLHSATGLEAEEALPDFDGNQLHLDEVADFIRCVETRAAVNADGQTGWRGLVCAAAAIESSAAGQRIDLQIEEMWA